MLLRWTPTPNPGIPIGHPYPKTMKVRRGCKVEPTNTHLMLKINPFHNHFVPNILIKTVIAPTASASDVVAQELKNLNEGKRTVRFDKNIALTGIQITYNIYKVTDFSVVIFGWVSNPACWCLLIRQRFLYILYIIILYKNEEKPKQVLVTIFRILLLELLLVSLLGVVLVQLFRFCLFLPCFFHIWCLSRQSLPY